MTANAVLNAHTLQYTGAPNKIEAIAWPQEATESRFDHQPLHNSSDKQQL